ncbi:MAG: hypothetical protein KBC06_01810 [Candidatus Pacebacteria bacterium]|nr:hypothetical protein [Candidatus Paceibacterota bacterium]
MANVNQLRTDVKWWTDELRARQEKVSEAVRMLAERQRELVQAEQEEAREATHHNPTY